MFVVTRREDWAVWAGVRDALGMICMTVDRNTYELDKLDKLLLHHHTHSDCICLTLALLWWSTKRMKGIHFCFLHEMLRFISQLKAQIPTVTCIPMVSAPSSSLRSSLWPSSGPMFLTILLSQQVFPASTSLLSGTCGGASTVLCP